MQRITEAIISQQPTDKSVCKSGAGGGGMSAAKADNYQITLAGMASGTSIDSYTSLTTETLRFVVNLAMPLWE